MLTARAPAIRAAPAALCGAALCAALLWPPSAAAEGPRAARLTLRVERVLLDHGHRVARLGSRVRIGARLRPWARGQTVTVRVWRGRRKVLARRLGVQKVKGRSAGRVLLGLTVERNGRYLVRATHYRGSRLGQAVAAPRRFSVRYPSLAAGDRGPAVRLLQRLLARRGYAVPRSGIYDGGTARAVLAFRKVNGMARTLAAPRSLFARLARGGGFRLRRPGAGRHVEVDLSRQVMVLARGRRGRRGRIWRVYPVSTGSPATPTVQGRFRFYLRQPGYNGKRMYFSFYFHGNYAIHGFDPVPVYPASHGCIRLPIPSAVSVYDWLRAGDPIYVYP